MQVEIRAIGDRRSILPPTEIPAPEGDTCTLREVIAACVKHSFGRFTRRRGEHTLAEVLDAENGSNLAEATDHALEAFTEGVFLVMVNGKPCRDLDEELTLVPTSTVGFVRLSAFASR